jgi:hypothetical protein
VSGERWIIGLAANDCFWREAVVQAARVSDDCVIGIDRNPRHTGRNQTFNHPRGFGIDSGRDFSRHLRKNFQDAGLIADNSRSIVKLGFH